MYRRTRSAKMTAIIKTIQKRKTTRRRKNAQSTSKEQKCKISPGKAKKSEESQGIMPPVWEVVEERAREEAALRAWREMDERGSEDVGAESGRKERQGAGPAARAQSPGGAALLPRLAAALLPRRAVLLRRYLRLLQDHRHHHPHPSHRMHHRRLRVATDQLVRRTEETLMGCGAEGGGGGEWEELADGVVLCGWLALASVWSAPRVPRAALALRRAAAALRPPEAEELARALLVALPAGGALLQLSDACAGAALGPPGPLNPLGPLLLRAALAQVCGHNAEEVEWSRGAPSGDEAAAALSACWPRLDVRARLRAVSLMGRVLAAQAGRGGAAVATLLHAHRRDEPRACQQEPPFLEVNIALKKLKVLF